MNTDATSATRYALTYLNSDGVRVLAISGQGRDTYATREEAEDYLEALLRVNSIDRIRLIWGPAPRFEVRPVECWPGHFDPKSIYFD